MFDNYFIKFYLSIHIYSFILVQEKLGYNKIQSRYIHEILLMENNKYKNNYFDIEHLNNFEGGMIKSNNKSKKIIEDTSEKVENVKFIYINQKIIFQKINYGEQIHFSLNTLDDKGECLVIILSASEIQTNKKKIQRTADINQISMGTNCPLVGKMYSGGGSVLLKIAIEFIKSIKEEYNITIIQIKDNSEKFCVNKKVKLWLLNTLKDGVPWHIKYNFQPLDEITMCVSEINKVKIIANRRILERTKTSVIDEEKIFSIKDKKIQDIYDKNKNKSIQIFFNKIFNESNKNCTPNRKHSRHIGKKIITV